LCRVRSGPGRRGASYFSESGRLGGALSAEKCGDSCFRFTNPLQNKVGDLIVERELAQRSSFKKFSRPAAMASLLNPSLGSSNKQMNAPLSRIPIVATALIMRWLGSEQNCLPKFNSNMNRLPMYRRYERGAAAIPGTGMLNRIAESPQFVKPQAKLSTVLAGSEGDWCESLAPGGYDPIRPSPDGAGMESVAGPRSSAMIVGQVSDPLWLPVDGNVHRYEWGGSR